MKTKQETNIINLLNEINQINEPDLMNRILSYCEETDTDVQELGDILGESDQFKRQFWLDAVKNHQIRDEGVQRKLNQTLETDVW